MTGNDDFSEMAKQDLEKFQRMNGDGFDSSVPALVELVFTSLTAFVALAWFVALWFTPDPIPSDMWLGLGSLGMIVFGLPAASIFLLRRGGADVIRAIVYDFTR